MNRACLAVLGGWIACAAPGCAGGFQGQQARQGLVVYLDGAGGGSLLTNWGHGVRDGLRQADYPSAFLHYSWQTGLGVLADQNASVDYKRGRARELARQVRDYQRQHPGTPVEMIGLSAGTALAVFTLEELSPSAPVENVVLLGSSLSAHYNLTEALKRVNGRFYVFVSDRDDILKTFVPLTGTADREHCGACAAGLLGFHWPPQADIRLARLYAKVENVYWRPEFARSGNLGGHTDAVNAAFVRDFVAPLFIQLGPRFREAGQQPVVLGPAGEPAGPGVSVRFSEVCAAGHH